MPNNLNGNKSITVYNGNMIELKPVSEAKARLLMNRKKAKVICTLPFTIRLNYVKKID
jgi:hypothetical protein